MQKPDVVVSVESDFPKGLFDDFLSAVNHENLNIETEEREPSGLQAGVVWYLLTAAVIFLSKSYFDGFLKEAGKDHYLSLKKALANTTNKVMSTPRIEPTFIGSAGKVDESDPYSMAFSIYAEANDGKRFKLLIPKPSVESNYTNIVFKFLEFLNDFHSGILALADIGVSESSREKLILVYFNVDTGNIEYLNSRNEA